MILSTDGLTELHPSATRVGNYVELATALIIKMMVPNLDLEQFHREMFKLHLLVHPAQYFKSLQDLIGSDRDLVNHVWGPSQESLRQAEMEAFNRLEGYFKHPQIIARLAELSVYYGYDAFQGQIILPIVQTRTL